MPKNVLRRIVDFKITLNLGVWIFSNLKENWIGGGGISPWKNNISCNENYNFENVYVVSPCLTFFLYKYLSHDLSNLCVEYYMKNLRNNAHAAGVSHFKSWQN